MSSNEPIRDQPQRLSTRECRAWLSDHHEGRLGYLSGRGHRAVVVLYAIAGGQIIVRLPDYNDIVHYAPGREISLEVDGPRLDERETVSVVGTAELVDGARLPLSERSDLPERWPDGVRTSVMRLPMTHLEGFLHAA